MRKPQANPWNSRRLKRPQPARLHHFRMARQQKSLHSTLRNHGFKYSIIGFQISHMHTFMNQQH
jgi:hypothetical protein